MNNITFPFAFLLKELRRSNRWIPILILIPIVLALSLVSTLLVQHLPASLMEVIRRTIHLTSPTELATLGSYLTLYLFLFWLSSFQCFQIFLVPKEEQMLPFYLSKPMTRTGYVAVHLFSSLCTLTFFAVVTSMGSYGIIQTWCGSVSLTHYLAGCAIVLSLTFFLLLVSNFIFLFMKDLYYALGISFLLWFLPLIPFQVYIYRPELFQDRLLLSKIVLFPANLVWQDAQTQFLLPLFPPFLLLGCLVFFWKASNRIERMDL